MDLGVFNVFYILGLAIVCVYTLSVLMLRIAPILLLSILEIVIWVISVMATIITILEDKPRYKYKRVMA